MKDLANFREKLGKTQIQMADIIGVSASFYMKIEAGFKTPSYGFITKFKKAFPQIDTNIFFKV